MNNNIFEGRIGDATAYFAFYVVIPIVITTVSLSVPSTEPISNIYCFVTILVSIFNGIYDAGNRWRPNERSRRNLKLSIIMLSKSLIAIYCLYVIFAALITQELPKRWDYAFFAYLGTCVVAIWDLGASFWKNVSWTDENGGENDDP